MKRILTLLFLFFSIQFASAGTIIRGSITQNAIWTKAGSPYYITKGTDISGGVLLTIEPGVDVIIQTSVYTVSGSISAIGTEEEPIHFLADTSLGESMFFRGILFFMPSDRDSIRLRNCIFSYFAKAISYHYSYVYPSVEIDDCVFEHCKQAVGIGPSTGHVRGCVIKNGQDGIFAEFGQSQIENNKFYNLTGTAIDLWTLDKTHYAITNNTLLNCHDGIVTYNDSLTTIAGNIIYGDGNGVGIKIGHESSIYDLTNITNNQIAYNKTAISANSNKPIRCTGNTIKYNETGIEIIYSPSEVIIFGNCIDSNGQYYIKNLDTNNKDLPDNYWGLADSLSIRHMIYDKRQNNSLGAVIFSSYKEEPGETCSSIGYPPYTGINAALPSTTSIDVYPNPFTHNFTISSNNLQIEEIALWNITGTLMHGRSRIFKNSVVIESNMYPAGIYIYNVKFTDRSTQVGRIWKQ